MDQFEIIWILVIVWLVR